MITGKKTTTRLKRALKSKGQRESKRQLELKLKALKIQIAKLKELTV